MCIETNKTIDNLKIQLYKYLEDPSNYYSSFTFLAKKLNLKNYTFGITSLLGVGSLAAPFLSTFITHKSTSESRSAGATVTRAVLPVCLYEQLDLELSKVKNHDDFCSYLKNNIKEKKIRKIDAALACGFSPSYFYDICNGTQKNLSRDTIIRIALGLQLDINETSELMMRLGYSLFSTSVNRDMIITFCINNKTGLRGAHRLLKEYNEAGLGIKNKESYRRRKGAGIEIKKNSKFYKSIPITKCS
jgi:predicted transcriptional regulator